LVRECVVARLLVHKHLQGKRPVPALFEQTGGQRIETAFLQSVEQMGSTLLAGPALRPVGRVVHTYVFFTADYWSFMTLHRQERSAAPLPANTAVACPNRWALVGNLKLNCAAQAAARQPCLIRCVGVGHISLLV